MREIEGKDSVFVRGLQFVSQSNSECVCRRERERERYYAYYIVEGGIGRTGELNV